MGLVHSAPGLRRVNVVFGMLATLGIVYLVENTLLAAAVLIPFWIVLFRPWGLDDALIFSIASLFFLGQNYAVLKTGGFAFTHKDVLLMPYYEPFLWGVYYLALKRFIGEPAVTVRLQWNAFFGLFLTGFCFSVFSGSSDMLWGATLVSTAVLFLMFHERYDLVYALSALVLGLVVELFGVSAGLWEYPDPDFLGIPYWFATMWLSVGLLGRRFLIPLAELAARRIRRTITPLSAEP
ncbi:MAG: hypothetical protein AB1805_01965 [Nitrospirota bacterium]